MPFSTSKWTLQPFSTRTAGTCSSPPSSLPRNTDPERIGHFSIGHNTISAYKVISMSGVRVYLHIHMHMHHILKGEGTIENGSERSENLRRRKESKERIEGLNIGENGRIGRI
eukprot:1362600-Amorphochlora_amoeboformis.AAC.2